MVQASNFEEIQGAVTSGVAVEGSGHFGTRDHSGPLGKAKERIGGPPGMNRLP